MKHFGRNAEMLSKRKLDDVNEKEQLWKYYNFLFVSCIGIKQRVPFAKNSFLKRNVTKLFLKTLFEPSRCVFV